MNIKYINNLASKILTVAAISCLSPVFALEFAIDPKTDVIGEVKYIISKKGQDLHSIARDYDLGLLELQEANPSIKNPDKLKPGTKLVIPTAFILPPGDRTGIVINLAEIRVYYFSPDGKTVFTHPLGIGKQGWGTPIGETTIVRKREHPTWTPPANIREEEEARGIDLPDVYPAGPNNPLGEYAMSLGWNGYEMHGTNAPKSIGLRSSHGCMRMYPEDIKSLFSMVPVGTKVRVMYEPYKLGVKDGDLFLEAHELFTDNYYNIDHNDKFTALQQTVKTVDYPDASTIDWNQAKKLVKDAVGYPVNISEVSDAAESK
jgi:L,D-transpeptidase ErfK/SrfK